MASSSCVRASGCQSDPAGQFNGGAPAGKMRGLRSYFVKRHTPLIYHHFDLLISLLFWPGESHGLENPMDCIVHGVTKGWTQLRDFHFTFKLLKCFIDII